MVLFHRTTRLFLVGLLAVSTTLAGACTANDTTSAETRAALERGRELARIAKDSADSVARWTATMAPRPGDPIDSALTVEEQLRRFRAEHGVTERSSGLVSGAPTRDSLVRAFVQRLALADTSGLAALLITPAEFADLYYPDSRYARPPYQLSPQLLWMQIQLNSEKGFTRLLRRVAGSNVTYVSHACPTAPDSIGTALAWEGCRVVTTTSGGAAETRRLFGGIFEHNGRFKFLGYANEM